MIRQWEVFYGKGSKRALAGERCITILEPIWTKGKNKFSFSFMRSVQSLHQKGREHYLYVIRQSSTENNVNKTCFYTCIQAPKSKQSHHQHSFVLQLNVSIYIYQVYLSLKEKCTSFKFKILDGFIPSPTKIYGSAWLPHYYYSMNHFKIPNIWGWISSRSWAFRNEKDGQKQP